MVKYALLALVIWNGITFFMMGFDKRQAAAGGWRIPEKRLFLCSFLFGGAGVAFGMSVFRHKTKHLSFRMLVPLSILADAAIAVMAVWYLKLGK